MNEPYDQEKDTDDEPEYDGWKFDHFAYSPWVTFACAGLDFFLLWQWVDRRGEVEHPLGLE